MILDKFDYNVVNAVKDFLQCSLGVPYRLNKKLPRRRSFGIKTVSQKTHHISHKMSTFGCRISHISIMMSESREPFIQGHRGALPKLY